MEETKKKAINEVAKEKIEKPDYNQLENWCNQLLLQRNQLAEKLRQVTDVLNKLPWLFKVIENKDLFDSNFVEYCKQDVMFIMTPPSEDNPEKSEEEESKD